MQLTAQSQASAARPVVHVAVGVLLRAEVEILLTTRPVGKVYAGYWEFPGGKLEAGESVHEALTRELDEELGIQIDASHPLMDFQVDYPHALVHLWVRTIRFWRGELTMREGQSFAWVTLPPACEPILPGAVPILKRLQAHWAESQTAVTDAG